MKMKGAKALIEALKKEGVEVIFGIPGGAVLPIFDYLYDDKDIRFILTRHEQGAAHMADGYARATGKVGVCIATSGPGATNLTTGIATAFMDSVPIVAITGQVMTTLVGNDAFQEADTTGITRPITKYNVLITKPEELIYEVKKAFYLAKAGRPGPVLIDIPVDIQRSEVDFKYPDKIDVRGYKPKYEGHPKQIRKAAEAISRSKRPIIYYGGGVTISGAYKELRELVRITEIPVTSTLMGLGAIECDNPYYLGMLGMHGTVYSNRAIQNSDLIIAIGARFDDRVTGRLDKFAPHAKVIHIDIDPSSISKNVPVDIPIVGDCKNVLREINKLLKRKEYVSLIPKKDRKEWWRRINEWKKEFPLKYKNDNKLRPQYIVERISELTKGEAIITTEVGQNQMWAAQFYKYKYPRQFLTSGGLGTMGYGLPSAIGAKVGRPDKVVIDIAGDGSIQMNIQELATATCNKIKVIVAVLNNSFLGMVRQWQELFFGKKYSAVWLQQRKKEYEECKKPEVDRRCGIVPDLVKIAESYGWEGIRVTRKDEVDSAIKKALSSKNSVLIDFWIEEEENVFPMVPAGRALDEMLCDLG